MGKITKPTSSRTMTKTALGVSPNDIAVDPKKLLLNQEAAILDTTELICALMKEADISRSDLAARMGTTKSNITQILDGSRNMTIRTVSDVMTHLGHEFRASCKAREFRVTNEQPHVVVRVMAEFRIPMPQESIATLPKNIEVQQLVDTSSGQSIRVTHGAIQSVGA